MRALVPATTLLLCVTAGVSCNRTSTFHESDQVREQVCVNCHRAAFEAALQPRHTGLFPTECTGCHATSAWVPASASHHNWFPLRNKHAAIPCISCHTRGYVSGSTPSDCAACHQSNYDAATAPPHTGFPTACQTCHTDAGWKPSLFTHPWPLQGNHAATACSNCHTGNPPRYAGTSHDCVSCHRAAYDSATSPPHASYSTACNICHTPSGWKPSVFNHTWPLQGKHATADCGACHTGTPPRWAGTPTDCVSCHRPAYDAATAPSHAGYPTVCATCHTALGWKPSVFNHPWSLQGTHATTDCPKCHTGNPPRWAGTPTECVSCHLANYTRAAAPPHAGLPVNCQTCHGPVAWKPWTGSHTWWTFEGAHTSVACAGCHTGSPPRWAGTPTNCAGCHLADFQRSTYPGHQTFPQTCDDCHSKAAWKPATGLHPEAKFPIASGRHANAGITCTSCHIAALGPWTGGQNTDCIHCHLGSHQRPAIDSKHRGVSRYPAGAAPVGFCLPCHPKGRE